MDQGGAGKFEFQDWIYLGMFFYWLVRAKSASEIRTHEKNRYILFRFRSLLNKLMYKNGTKNAVDWEERLAHLIIFFFKLFFSQFRTIDKGNLI